MAKRPATSTALEDLVAGLPALQRPLQGQRGGVPDLPDNLICFRRTRAEELNKPQKGRALHHRYVLILALRTAVTVCVDDRKVRLEEGEGMLVQPFQFHDYEQPAGDELLWLFVTFEHPGSEALAGLRYRKFAMSLRFRQQALEFLSAYARETRVRLAALLLAVLLELAGEDLVEVEIPAAPVVNDAALFSKVNQLALSPGQLPTVKEMAKLLGISSSHLRSRFRASCGVSLGKHLRRLRMEKACGLLRLSQRRVSEIAELCGFTSIYSFSRAFRSEYGLSPLEYRHGGRPGGGAAGR